MLSMTQAVELARAAMAHAEAQGYGPLCVVVLDAGGHDLALIRSERAPSYRVAIARAKAAGCIGMGQGGRALAERAKANPAFFAALVAITPGGLVPAPGGVLIQDGTGAIVGAVGVSGDTPDHDEAAALAGIAAAGLAAQTGA